MGVIAYWNFQINHLCCSFYVHKHGSKLFPHSDEFLKQFFFTLKKKKTEEKINLTIYQYAIKLTLHTVNKTCVKRPLQNRQNKDLNDKWQLNEGQKYCRMLCLDLRVAV